MSEHNELDTQSHSARQRARAHLIEAVRALGLPASSAEDAWGRLVGVQARIALDEGSGARATAAAKLVAQATGLIDAPELQSGEDGWARIRLDADGAQRLLELVRAERARRKSAQGEG